VTALFVTASGTDIGKTFVAAGLIAELRRQGRAVAAIKPVVSGFAAATAAASDPGILLTALGRPVTALELDRISPWRFQAPLAPDLAAKREGRVLDFSTLVEFSRHAIAAADDVLLIEGVGGIMVPLDERHTVLDWMIAVRVPTLLVVGSYLGTISHTLSALDVMRHRNLQIAGIVISESPGSPVPLADTAGTIARFVQPIEVHAVPRLPPGTSEHPVFRRLAALL